MEDPACRRRAVELFASYLTEGHQRIEQTPPAPIRDDHRPRNTDSGAPLCAGRRDRPPSLLRTHPPRRGTADAITIARRCGRPLDIAGIVADTMYFDEPFGFSVAEALGSGTPVIAFERGSMAELVVDGMNGYLGSDGLRNLVKNAEFEELLIEVIHAAVFDEVVAQQIAASTPVETLGDLRLEEHADDVGDCGRRNDRTADTYRSHARCVAFVDENVVEHHGDEIRASIDVSSVGCRLRQQVRLVDVERHH